MNIVFDLGGVVFHWQPDKIIESVFSDIKTQQIIKTEIFNHRDWVELDRGTLDLQQAIHRGALRTKLPFSDIAYLMNKVPQFLTPIDDTIELLNSISETDNKFFVLSNMHFSSITHLEKEYPIWDIFDGKVISCRIQKVKPEIGIYQYLLSTHNLVAEETVFIDDMDINLTRAASLGIQTIKFTSASQCRQALSELKCI